MMQDILLRHLTTIIPLNEITAQSNYRVTPLYDSIFVKLDVKNKGGSARIATSGGEGSLLVIGRCSRTWLFLYLSYPQPYKFYNFLTMRKREMFPNNTPKACS
ncbi:hypothetical protein DTX80_15210 [Bacilli bacterium]|nr:hypothetical protein WH51_15020 [Bacilli bacterium VT-13-104]PZD81484.1 hypothetical protein DEJ64_17020 [Bacilli bacterium]PZD83510.1 hypothetical protein DEJ60_16950 [Bacilli bacterium]PZD85105.1 hypothetical protein DEJ66_17155 [Bacilli bacterium]RCO04735.1 hypothetical protein DTX80_15210 [Bacilli bacterium]